jgi:hypothetical protein
LESEILFTEKLYLIILYIYIMSGFKINWNHRKQILASAKKFY